MIDPTEIGRDLPEQVDWSKLVKAEQKKSRDENRRTPSPTNVPLAVILAYCELILSRKDLTKGVLAHRAWGERNEARGVTGDPENDPTFPGDHAGTIGYAAEWFALKAGVMAFDAEGGWAKSRVRSAEPLAYAILKGRIPGVRTQEAKDFLRDDQLLDFSESNPASHRCHPR